MCTGPAGLDAASGVDGVTVYHAGTAAGAEGTVTSGGRVLAVTGQAGCLKDAVAKAYEGVGRRKRRREKAREDDLAAAASKGSMAALRRREENLCFLARYCNKAKLLTSECTSCLLFFFN